MKVAAIHANMSAVEPLNLAFQNIDPNVRVINFVNEEMLRIVDEEGTVSDRALRMFAKTVFAAADAAVDGIMIACSVYCAYVEEIKPFLHMPVVAVDAPALSAAVDRGGKIGILATTPASAPACRKKLEQLAVQRGIQLEYEEGVVPAALDALKRGDIQEHDQLIAREGERLTAAGCNTLFLSQITMARAMQAMGALRSMTLATPDEGAKELLRQITKH